jgi:hypothetical protein
VRKAFIAYSALASIGADISFVSRMRCSKSAFTRVFDALWRCTADPGSFQTQRLLRSRVCSAPLRFAPCCAAPGKRSYVSAYARQRGCRSASVRWAKAPTGSAQAAADGKVSAARGLRKLVAFCEFFARSAASDGRDGHHKNWLCGLTIEGGWAEPFVRDT